MIKIMKRITWLGFRFIKLSYSSLYLTSPPNPPGRFIPEFCAMFEIEGKTF